MRVLFCLVKAGLISMAFACGSFATAARFNDTGLIDCVARNGRLLTQECANSGQDAAYGRDTVRPSDRNGTASFSFKKLDILGRGLPPDSDKAACVLDGVTGLVWEIKNNDDDSLHFKDKTFTNTFGDPLKDLTDTYGFVEQTNMEGLCGYSDWRIPSMLEAITLTSYAYSDGMQGGLDERFFGDRGRQYWTRSCDGSNCLMTPFNSGSTIVRFAYDRYSAIAVRGKPLIASGKIYEVDGGVARDVVAGVVWQRCFEGTTLVGDQCHGTPFQLTWEEAIKLALAKSRETGQSWRLPNIKELTSVGHYPSKIDAIVFPSADPLTTWSSTFLVDPQWVWISSFGSFAADGLSRGSTAAIRLVRDDDR